METHLLPHSQIMTRLKRISVSSSWYPERDGRILISCLSTRLDESLDVLDLSGLRIDIPYQSAMAASAERHEMARELMREHFPKSTLFKQVGTLMLGPWLTPELRDALAASHPNLNVL